MSGGKKRSIMVFLLCCVSDTIYFDHWMVMVTEWISITTPRFACLRMGFLARTAKFELSIFGRLMSSFFLLLSFPNNLFN
jgi:hypothetical protein